MSDDQIYVGRFVVDGEREIHMYREGDHLVEGDPPDEEPNDPPALFKSMREANDRLAKKVGDRDIKVDQLTQELRTERVERAFMLAASKAGIAKLGDALRLADLSGIEVADDGAVTGVEKVVEELVADRPYLLAAKTTASPDDELPLEPSGAPMNRSRNRARPGLTRAALEARYPALRNRR